MQRSNKCQYLLVHLQLVQNWEISVSEFWKSIVIVYFHSHNILEYLKSLFRPHRFQKYTHKCSFPFYLPKTRAAWINIWLLAIWRALCLAVTVTQQIQNYLHLVITQGKEWKGLRRWRNTVVATSLHFVSTVWLNKVGVVNGFRNALPSPQITRFHAMKISLSAVMFPPSIFLKLSALGRDMSMIAKIYCPVFAKQKTLLNLWNSLIFVMNILMIIFMKTKIHNYWNISEFVGNALRWTEDKLNLPEDTWETHKVTQGESLTCTYKFYFNRRFQTSKETHYSSFLLIRLSWNDIGYWKSMKSFQL